MPLTLRRPVVHVTSFAGRCVLALLAAITAPATASSQAATGTIAGQVTDVRSTQGLEAVSVQVEGTRFGAATGADGRYRIAGVPAGSYTLTTRRIGYGPGRQAVTVAPGATATANFALAPMATSLDEVVVTGTAGGEQRRSIGNAVTTINATEATSKAAAQSLSTLIGARAPGVIIGAGTGRLGAGPTVQVRGRSSIGLDNSPLLYVDGVRVNNRTAAGPVGITGRLGGQASNVGGRLNDIDPDDIESIEIIKGPAAATIYGTEAANGVIQIITKKGRAGGSPEVALRVQNGTIHFLDAEDRIPTNYYRIPASGEIVAWNGVKSEEELGRPIYQRGQTRAYDVAVSGGGGVARYYVSGAYQNDLGVEPNNSLRQLNFRGNLNLSLRPTLEMATNVGFANISSRLGTDVGVSALLGATAGHGSLFTATRGFFAAPPEVPQTLYDNVQGVGRFTGSTTLSHRPAGWFTQRLVLGIDHTSDDSRAIERFAGPDLAPLLGSAATGSIGQTLRRDVVISTDYSASAQQKLTSAVSLTTSVGGQYYRNERNESFLGGTNFPGQGVETVSAITQPVTPTQTQILNTTIGAYGQLQLGVNDRLFLTGALRVDNNSAFGSDLKWVTYPKVSAAWVVNEEGFWPANRFVNALKLRAAYGESGRQPVAFSALRTFSPSQGPGGTTAVTPNSIGNSDLRPERGKEFEVGLDGSLFDRLSLELTFFDKRVTDVIISQPVAPSSGFFRNRFANLGRVDNRGFELGAALQAITRENFSWEIVGNIATNKDEIRDLGGVGGIVLNAGQTNVVGYPIGGIFTRRVVSADRDATTGLPTNILCDGGDSAEPVACATAPFVYIGSPTPSRTGAVSNTLWLFKQVRLYGLVDFKRGHRMQNQNELIRCLGLVGAPLCRQNYYPLEYDPVHLAERTGNANALGITDQYWQDASFAKLREVSVTYELPERLRGGLSRAAVSLAGRDLHTWTSYGGLDPEGNAVNPATSFSAADQAVLPPLTRFIATVSLTF